MTAPRKGGNVSSHGEERDHYRLLQIDPDAPHELIVEAYWYVAGKLRAEQMAGKAAKQELLALNAAYADLVDAERRHSYDATIPRVADLRRARAALGAEQKPSILARFLHRSPARHPQQHSDYYAILAVDPQADKPLIARAYAILRSLHPEAESGSRQTTGVVADLEAAYSVLLDKESRAHYDLSLSPITKPAEAGAEEAPVEAEPARPEEEPFEVASKDTKEPPPEANPLEQSEYSEITRRHLSLRPIAKATRAAGRFLGHHVALAGRSATRGVKGATGLGGRGSLALAQAMRRMIKQWRNGRSQEQAIRQADLLDQRVLRDAVPPPLRKETQEERMSLSRARLVITRAYGESDSVALGDNPITLGSDHTCDVILEADSGLVAAAHAQIWFTGDNFVIRSLSPRYATRIGGSTVNWAMLDDGDEIEIGHCRIRFEAIDAGEPVPDYLSLHHSPH